MGEPQIKGTACRSMLGAARRLCGDDIVERILPRLPADFARTVKHNGFVTAGWYPLSQYRAMVHAILAASGKGPELARALGREGTRDDFRGIYRVLTFMLSPEFLMRRSPGVFNRYYDTGTLEIPVAKNGYCEARYTGCAGFDRALWEDVFGGSVAILEACGGKNVRMTVTAGGGDGDADAYVVGNWD